jgi:hypothetical protein
VILPGGLDPTCGGGLAYYIIPRALVPMQLIATLEHRGTQPPGTTVTDRDVQMPHHHRLPPPEFPVPLWGTIDRSAFAPLPREPSWMESCLSFWLPLPLLLLVLLVLVAYTPDS